MSPAKDGLDELHADILGLAGDIQVPVNVTVECVCKEGYTSRKYCQAVCGVNATWVMVSECKAIQCWQPPPDIRNGQAILMTAMETGGYYNLGDVVRYECYPGYLMVANDSMQCGYSRYGGERGVWTAIEAERPACVRNPDCGAPPNVTNAVLLGVNSTREFGMARYECGATYLTIGDGTARCMTTHVVNQHSVDVRYVRWLYVPECERKCVIPDGKHGDQPSTWVDMTKCTSNSFSPYMNRVCENPDLFNLAKDTAETGQAMMFYGDELCVALEVTRMKFAQVYNHPKVDKPGYPRQECVQFCLPGHGGHKEVDVMEKLVFDENGDAEVERVTYKFVTRGME